MDDYKCFADLGNRCRALINKECAECAFFKSKNQHIKDKEYANKINQYKGIDTKQGVKK